MRQQVMTKGERTRVRLLEVSAALFARHSFHGTRISDIVKAAGVTQPSFYSYFQSKEDIYAQLITQFNEELEELVVSMLIDASLPKKDVLKNITFSFRRYLDFFLKNRELTMICLFQPPQDGETRHKLLKWITRNMKIEQQRGFFSQGIPVNVLASCYLGVLIQTLHLHPTAAELDKISEERGRFLVGGLTWSPSSSLSKQNNT